MFSLVTVCDTETEFGQRERKIRRKKEKVRKLVPCFIIWIVGSWSE